MKYVALPLALSVGLLALSATPSAAQIRRSTPTAPAAAPAAAATPAAAKPRTEVRIFLGPAFGMGNRNSSVSRTTATSTTTTNGPSGSPPTTTTTTDASPSAFVPSTFGDGLGLMYGVDATWWGSDRMGLGLSLFGAYLGAGQSNDVLHPTSGMQTTITPSSATTYNQSVFVTSGLPGGLGSGFSASTAPSGALAAGNTQLATTYSGFVSPTTGVTTPFTLTTGQSAASNPNTTYSGTAGGVNFNYGRTLFLNDVSLQETFRLFDDAQGGASFFGGLIIPTGFDRRTFTAKTVGADGKGDTATETSTVTTNAEGTDSYKTVTSYTYKQTYTADTSLIGLGPVLGLNAHYNVGTNLRVYTQIGYVPVVAGTATNNFVSTVNNKSRTEVTVTGTPAGAPAAGITEASRNTTTPSQTTGNFGGSMAMGSLGAGFNLAGLNLFAEGTARSYNFGTTANNVIYGLKLGTAFQF